VGKVWVLDTETKGTGAQMVPLEKVLKKPAPRKDPPFIPPRRKPRQPKPAEPRQPLSFKVVDVTTRAVLADRVGAREALRALHGFRSIVDVHVFLWEPTAERWRLLTLEEQRTMWDRRTHVNQAPGE
jgi:hypothetical protein